MRIRLLTCTLIAACALAAPGHAEEADQDTSASEEITQANYPWTVIPETLLELAFLRPLGAAATAAGVPMFIASAPLMWPSGDFGWSWDVFVMAPFDYTFTRPFRDF